MFIYVIDGDILKIINFIKINIGVSTGLILVILAFWRPLRDRLECYLYMKIIQPTDIDILVVFNLPRSTGEVTIAFDRHTLLNTI